MSIPRMNYPQYRKARKLVRECCNYCDGNCLLLDDGEECVCVQSISYSLLCRWFRAAVLPLDAALCAEITKGRDEVKRCSECYYAHLSINDRLTFIKGMNEVLPYVENREAFISYIKYSMKENQCKTLDFDCWVNDFMAVSRSECILTDEGYEAIKRKYSDEIEKLLEEMNRQHELDEDDEKARHKEYMELDSGTETDGFYISDDDELPFN